MTLILQGMTGSVVRRTWPGSRNPWIVRLNSRFHRTDRTRGPHVPTGAAAPFLVGTTGSSRPQNVARFTQPVGRWIEPAAPIARIGPAGRRSLPALPRQFWVGMTGSVVRRTWPGSRNPWIVRLNLPLPSYRSEPRVPTLAHFWKSQLAPVSHAAKRRFGCSRRLCLGSGSV
jgi:hypothetical protein